MKGRLSQDVWYIDDDANYHHGEIVTEDQMKELVYKIGNKGDPVTWDEECGCWEHDDIGTFIYDSEFIEVYSE